jgi:hypothetical protein
MEPKDPTPFQYPIGSQCAVTFLLDNDAFLLPAIVLDYPTHSTINVLLLTPVTQDTVPCSTYFQQSSCESACQRSHGYTSPIELIAPIEILTENVLDYGHRVWCKTDNDPVWIMGRIVDQLQDLRWRIKLRGHYKRTAVVDPEYVIPYKSLLDEEGSSSSTTTDKEGVDAVREEEEEEEEAVKAIGDAFGSWQLHTTGFASKMMKKMGYIEVG